MHIFYPLGVGKLRRAHSPEGESVHTKSCFSAFYGPVQTQLTLTLRPANPSVNNK